MPFQSEAQRRFLWATEPDVAQRWADEYPGQKNLPYHKGDKKKEKKGLDSMSIVAQLGQAASALPYVEKLAHDAEISKDLVYKFAEMTQLTPIQFVKLAYQDVDGFIDFLKVVSGAATKQQVMTKKAGGGMSALLERLRGALGSAGSTAQRAWEGATGATKLLTELRGVGPQPQVLKQTGGFLGTSDAATMPGKLMQQMSPLGQSHAGRLASGTTAAGGGALVASKMLGGGQQAPQQEAPKAEGAKVEAPSEGVKNSPQENMGRGAASTGAGEGNNMSPAAKALLLGGGAAALGGGAYMLANRRKKKDKQAGDARSISINAMKRAIEKKAQDLYRKEAASILVSHLDKVAQHVSMEKQASLRTVQREVASGKDLSLAIKLAYPHLSGEQRGILAHKMCEAAMKSHQKRASAGGEKKVKTQKMETFNGPPSKALQAVK